ncbi:PLP-dependent aminotransferase family protein [Marinobacterium sp. AK62]|uniref:PLP-dependent aminotransferase family protein n=1 Tax=Marinobacterium alkalitolerans TaxID=1542925 RepID=A0ABS3ZCV1_9GAMM|nr:PLP-dependent aminotransferase family protein [Marinobacterium alkalitolerans]MBP0049456.1 PLP-dependent aminotransferase family protein [Marinobacterium alkalitolerans]
MYRPDALNRRSGYRYQQLEQWLWEGIQTQRWRPGERLPSIRALCESTGCSRATVQHALHRLEARGVLEARPRSGYFVCLLSGSEPPVHTEPELDTPRPATTSDLFRDLMQRSAAFDLLPEASSEPLSPGLVGLGRSIARALRRSTTQLHDHYDAPAGDLGLRTELARLYARRGWPARAEAFCITQGCQHALSLALQACCEPGDLVAVESPGFYGTLQLLEQLGLKVIEVPSHSRYGLDVEQLAHTLARWPVKACVFSAAFSTPAGGCLPDQARQRLLALAGAHDLALIEDDIYAETAFVQPPDPLKALDTEDRVILCSSFSKALSRDLRLGWIAGGRWHDRIVQLKLVTQLASSRFVQQGVAHFIADGGLATHLRRQRQQLRQQRDQLIQQLRDWPVPVRMSMPEGGLALWVELESGQDCLALYQKALAEGIVVTPGPLFSTSNGFRHCLRISFAHPWNEARRAALRDLSGLCCGG